ncbi:DUF420 domain-containing protein [Sporosarcina gallistercoris]|uniref:DUF420 domain-containing protein n=1 Tax=Sporosarcina gallistercoris TaxID=2762245 RepID=A0ABR8PGF6_9BACL|nr:DUF420 domain-containing protein [Sporosarcina gallistercoris]MBD7907243.1 DUF420 domain-containing protein [Sporosarcina gallistercoris]
MNLPILPTLSTLLIIISGVLVGIGWMLIRKKRKHAHKNVMVAASISALLFLVIYLSRTIIIGNTAFGGPDNIKIYYTVFLIFHICLATTGAVLGVLSLISGFKDNLPKHRRLGPVTSIVWIFAALTGVAVYLLLYVFYAGGETTSMIKAILGF